MRILTVLLIVAPMGALAFRTIDAFPAAWLTITFLFGVTELVNLTYEIKKRVDEIKKQLQHYTPYDNDDCP